MPATRAEPLSRSSNANSATASTTRASTSTTTALARALSPVRSWTAEVTISRPG
jgi:hypothetical protein